MLKKEYILYFLFILISIVNYAATDHSKSTLFFEENKDMRFAIIGCKNGLILPPDLQAQCIKPLATVCNMVSVKRNENDQNMITLLPNPSANEIQVTSESKDIQSIELEFVNALGQQVIKSRMNMGGSPAVLSTQGLPDGNYQVRIRCKNFLIYKKVIITK